METEEMDVVAALIWREGRVLIAKSKAGSYMAGRWEFPGGKVERGEKPEDALIREIKEELGVEINVLDLFHVNNHVYDMLEKKRHIRLLSYNAELIRGEIQCIECQECRWANPKELKDYVFVDADIPVMEKLSS